MTEINQYFPIADKNTMTYIVDSNCGHWFNKKVNRDCFKWWFLESELL